MQFKNPHPLPRSGGVHDFYGHSRVVYWSRNRWLCDQKDAFAFVLAVVCWHEGTCGSVNTSVPMQHIAFGVRLDFPFVGHWHFRGAPLLCPVSGHSSWPGRGCGACPMCRSHDYMSTHLVSFPNLNMLWGIIEVKFDNNLTLFIFTH